MQPLLVGVVDFLLDLGGRLMVAAIDANGGSNMSFLECACPFISDALVSMVEMALA